MNLVEQSVAWVVPAALLALFIVFAMMRFTAALLVRPANARSDPLDAAGLRERLTALGDGGKPYRVVEGRDGGLELAWDVVDAAWSEGLARVKLSVTYRARMLLDTSRREVRWFESIRSSNVFLGFEGWRARWNASFFYRSGYLNVVWSGMAYGIVPGFPPRIGRVHAFHVDTVAVKDDIRAIVDGAGWGFRPVTLGLAVNPRWVRFVRAAADALVPAALRGWSERKLWGVLYPLSFVLFFAYVVGFLLSPDQLTLRDAGIMLGVAAGWWAVWGLLAWALLGFPVSRRRKRA